MDYRTYGYHCSGHFTQPRRSSGNIKGLELEISDYDCGDLLDELIEENILTVPSNETEDKEFYIAVEDDGSVFKELIFKASCNSTLLKGVKKLSEELHGKIHNGSGTSCHIHINNRYLDSKGISQLDLTKSAEFLAPILYSISGRSSTSMRDWANSIIRHEINIDNVDLFERCKHVDRIDCLDYERYRIVNVNPCNTTEIRIFSNRYGFDYDYIKMYLETTDFIMDIAEYMNGKNYVEEYDKLIEMCKLFFGKRKYKKIRERHNLDIYFLNEIERRLKTLEMKKEYILDYFDKFQNMHFIDNLNRHMELLRMLRNINHRYPLENVKFMIKNEIDEENILIQLINNIEKEFEEINEQ